MITVMHSIYDPKDKSLSKRNVNFEPKTMERFKKLATTKAIENLRWRDNPKVIPITRIATGL